MAHLCLWFSYRLSPVLDFRKRESHKQPTPMSLTLLLVCITGCKTSTQSKTDWSKAGTGHPTLIDQKRQLVATRIIKLKEATSGGMRNVWARPHPSWQDLYLRGAIMSGTTNRRRMERHLTLPCELIGYRWCPYCGKHCLYDRDPYTYRHKRIAVPQSRCV